MKPILLYDPLRHSLHASLDCSLDWSLRHSLHRSLHDQLYVPLLQLYVSARGLLEEQLEPEKERIDR